MENKMQDEVLESREEKKQVLYELITDKNYRPMRFKELAVLLMVPKAEREELKQTLDVLIHEGKIIVDTSSRYRAADANRKIGLFHGTSRGFGFVTVEGEKDDFFIPESDTKGALDGDTVRIYAPDERVEGKRREGRVLEIVARGTTQIVGTYQRGKSFGFVIPDNQKFAYDVFIPKDKTAGAVNGHKVLVRLTNYGDERRNPEGEVIQVLGHINDPGVDVLSVVYAYGIPLDYPQEVWMIDSILLTGSNQVGIACPLLELINIPTTYCSVEYIFIKSGYRSVFKYPFTGLALPLYIRLCFVHFGNLVGIPSQHAFQEISHFTNAVTMSDC